MTYAVLMQLGNDDAAQMSTWLVLFAIAAVLLGICAKVGIGVRGRIIAMAAFVSSTCVLIWIGEGKIDLHRVCARFRGTLSAHPAPRSRSPAARQSHDRRPARRLRNHRQADAGLLPHRDCRHSVVLDLRAGVGAIVAAMEGFQREILPAADIGRSVVRRVCDPRLRSAVHQELRVARCAVRARSAPAAPRGWFGSAGTIRTPSRTFGCCIRLFSRSATILRSTASSRSWCWRSCRWSLFLPRPASFWHSPLTAITVAAWVAIAGWAIFQGDKVVMRYILPALLLCIPLAAAAGEHVTARWFRPRILGKAVIAAAFATICITASFSVGLYFFPGARDQGRTRRRSALRPRSSVVRADGHGQSCGPARRSRVFGFKLQVRLAAGPDPVFIRSPDGPVSRQHGGRAVALVLSSGLQLHPAGPVRTIPAICCTISRTRRHGSTSRVTARTIQWDRSTYPMIMTKGGPTEYGRR